MKLKRSWKFLFTGSILYLLSAALLSSKPVEAMATLVVDPRATEMTHELSASLFGSQTARSTGTGTIDVRFKFDSETTRVSEFEMTGGTVTWAPTSLTLFGPSSSTLMLAFSEIEMRPSSLDGAEEVTNPDNLLDPARHELDVESGTATLTAIIPRQLREEEIIDLTGPPSADAVNPDLLSLFETLRVTLTQVSSDENAQRWRLNFISESNGTGSETGDGFTVTYTLRAGIQAEAEFEIAIPDYQKWLAREGLLRDTAVDALSRFRIPVGLLHAFDLSITARELPFEVVRDENGKAELVVTLPDSGSRRRILVQEMPNLDSQAVLNTLTTFEVGTSGVQRVPLTGEKGFYRLKVDVDDEG